MSSPEITVKDQILNGQIVTIGTEEWFDRTDGEETVVGESKDDIVQEDPDAIRKEGI